MSERRRQYPFHEIEPRWQAHWAEAGTFRAPNPGDPDFDPSKPKYYVLDMFPYPSGAGLHVGHPEGYTATDIVARQRRMRGFNVLHPMGWDAFGLPAEQYAIKTGQHPAETTARNVARFKEQLQKIGFAYDWTREINTTDPGYYRWTQWIFLQLYNSYVDPELGKARPISLLEDALSEEPKRKDEWKANLFLNSVARAMQHGRKTLSRAESLVEEQRYLEGMRLAYVAEAPVNWCPELGTVLANEEVIEGKSEVGGFPVVRRPMRQWMLRITTFAQRLIDELEPLDWPESIKTLQRNWIGRSEGALVRFAADGHEIEVFTTRPDTLFGATYMVLAPEHSLVDQLVTEEQSPAIREYRERTARKSDLERTELAKEKTGVFTGAYAVNPVNDERIPIWIADYVLAGYGTGAIMAVPAHDARDWEFAKKFDLPIREVVRSSGGVPPLEEASSGSGTAINSPPINGLETSEAKAKMIAWLEERGVGRGTINYKLRDWLFSRQRYWGEPFPIIWENGRHRAISETDLPLTPPELADFKPTASGEPPLARAADWIRYSDTTKRETNTMPQWAGSCWYYLRYCDPKNSDRFVGKEAEQYWMAGLPPSDGYQPSTLNHQLSAGVDLYVGGTEHAVLHLLYARFWHKVLHDLGHVSTPEPFHKLVNQGIILGEDGQKMSKSRGNVVNPDDVVDAYGADAFRLYEMFMGPLEQTKPWSMTGVEGVYRFLARVWRLVMEENQAGDWIPNKTLIDDEPNKALQKVLHATIKKVSEDIDALAFNTAIAQMMVCTNTLTGLAQRPASAVRTLLLLLNPFAPHITSELWEIAGGTGDIASQSWPDHDEKWLIEDEIELPVQVNGKVRDRITVALDATPSEIESAARASAKVQEHVGAMTIRKVIIVPRKLVNIVAG